MRIKDSETRYKRVWFGANARATIGPGFIHKAGLGGLVIPHPPLANWLLRLGLPGHLSRDLSFAHEFAHFQTAPVMFVYMLIVFVLALITAKTGMAEILFLLVSVQAAWEILSEGLVLLENSAAYRISYNGITRLPRVLFWTLAGMLTATGWVLLLQR